MIHKDLISLRLSSKSKVYLKDFILKVEYEKHLNLCVTYFKKFREKRSINSLV